MISQKHKRFAAIFCVVMVIGILILGTASAAVVYRSDSGGSGGGTTAGGAQRTSGGGSIPITGSGQENWTVITVGVILIIGLSYYLLKKEKAIQ